MSAIDKIIGGELRSGNIVIYNTEKGNLIINLNIFI